MRGISISMIFLLRSTVDIDGQFDRTGQET
jgi:hypothetical protein